MVHTARRLAITLLLARAVAAVVQAQDLPRGTIIDAVTCAGDSTQSYALYLPSAYSRAIANGACSSRSTPQGAAAANPREEVRRVIFEYDQPDAPSNKSGT